MTNFSKLNNKTKLSETQYYSVEKITGDSVQLKNDYGEKIEVNKNYVEKCLVTNDQVEEEKILTKTELAALFLSNPGVVQTVNFNKQVDKKDVKDSIAALYPNKGGKILSEAEYVRKVNDLLKSALEGDERTMVGRHNGSQDEFGRVHFIDMEVERDPSKTYDQRQRLVDPRTINHLILKGVKYKKK